MPTVPGARSLILVRVSAEYCYSCLRLGVETSFSSLDKVISDKSEQQVYLEPLHITTFFHPQHIWHCTRCMGVLTVDVLLIFYCFTAGTLHEYSITWVIIHLSISWVACLAWSTRSPVKEDKEWRGQGGSECWPSGPWGAGFLTGCLCSWWTIGT